MSGHPMTIEAVAERLSPADAEIAKLRHEIDMLTNGGIIEVAVRNPNVADYMAHWEARAEKAEAELSRRTPASGAGVVGDWRCAECGCHSYARMDERKPDGSFGPGPFVRCVNCKAESALSSPPPDRDAVLEGAIAWCREKEDAYNSMVTNALGEGRVIAEEAHRSAARAFGACRAHLSALKTKDRDAVLEEAARMADREELTGTPPADFTQREIYITQAAVIATAKSIATAIRALKTKDQP